MFESFVIVFGYPVAWLLTELNSHVKFIPEKGMTETFEGLAKLCGGLQLVFIFVLCFWKVIKSHE